MALSFKNMNHRDLRPSNIMIGQHHEDPKQKLYKIGYPLLMNPETMEKTYTPSNINVYFGPQMFEAVCKLSNRSFSLEKNDVYALGLIALEMATLAPVATVYDHQSGQVNALEIDKRLRVCR
jgi:serine/threonine protein kinase